MMTPNFLSPREFAAKHGLSPQTVRLYLREHRVEGVVFTRKAFLIPENAKLPNPSDDKRYVYVKCKYCSICETVERTKISAKRIRELLEQGEIKDIIQVDSYYYISQDWIPPRDKRYRSGKYVGWRKRKDYGKTTDDRQ